MNKKNRLSSMLLVAFLGSVIGILGFSLLVKPKTIIVQNDKPIPAQFTSLSASKLPTPDFREAAEKSVDAVVHVVTKSFISQYGYRSLYDLFFNNPTEQHIPMTGSGSGVIISPDGYIVTNNHVVEGSEEIEVGLNDGRTVGAKLVGRDPETDVAVIKIKLKDLPYLTFGNSDDLYVGDWVMAVGNPWNLGTTVTAGIVSAKGRNINIYKNHRQIPGSRQKSNSPRTAVESFIQTDAAVNQGNSGGALVNIYGELVGINAAIASPTGAYSGYSFAIPSLIVKKAVDDLIEFGKVHRAALGVTITNVTADLAKKKKLDVNQGSLVTDLVKDGGAQKAGIKIGDVIVKVENRKVVTNADLIERISSFSPGDQVSVTVNRNGSERQFQVTLQGMDVNQSTIGTAEFWTYLGADLETLKDKELKDLEIDGGVRVKKVHGGKFKEAGIPEGFVITSINRFNVNNVQDVKQLIERIDGGVFIEGVQPNGRYDYYTFRK
ncbi:MAG: trypsin-like peptidase domain-containing protein [Bacteroidales bacterium]|nr:trypsin-like peptidase domain-containing protein [Bacteroidales bacterium]